MKSTSPLNTKHVLNIFHNSLLGGDEIDVIAAQVDEGWRIEVKDSGSYQYILPSETIQDLSTDELEKFVDGIGMEDENSFVGGLVFGFLNSNWPLDRKLSKSERKDAAEFAEVESDDFPELAEKYRQRIADWAANHP
jgi:hypothetical protein